MRTARRLSSSSPVPHGIRPTSKNCANDNFAATICGSSGSSSRLPIRAGVRYLPNPWTMINAREGLQSPRHTGTILGCQLTPTELS